MNEVPRDVYVEWETLRHSVAAVHAARDRLFTWLPLPILHELLSDLSTASSPALSRGRCAAPLPVIAASSRPCVPQHGSGAAGATRAPQQTHQHGKGHPKSQLSTMNNETAVAATKETSECDYALALLSLLLTSAQSQYPSAPLPAAPQNGQHTSPEDHVMQLELICSCLLRHLPTPFSIGHFRAGNFFISATTATVEKEIAEASWWESVLTQAVVRSMTLWVHYFFNFFAGQLHTARSRYAALKRTVTQLQKSIPASKGIAPKSKSKTEVESDARVGRCALDTTIRAQRRSEPAEVALLRAYPSLRRGHHLHSYAQHIHDAVNIICSHLTQENSSTHYGDASSAAPAAARLAALHQKLNLTQKESLQRTTRRQSGANTKQAVGKGPKRRGISCRPSRRRVRESSSDTTSSDSSCSSSSSNEATASDSDNADSDEDVPLAFLAKRKQK